MYFFNAYSKMHIQIGGWKQLMLTVSCFLSHCNVILYKKFLIWIYLDFKALLNQNQNQNVLYCQVCLHI